MPADTTISPSRAEFLQLAATHSLVPVYRTLTADLETPVSAFLRLASDEPQSFLLESVEGGEKVGRYTFIGIRPYRTILSRGSSISISERGKTRSLQGDVFALLKELAGRAEAGAYRRAAAVYLWRGRLLCLRRGAPDRAPARAGGG